MGILDRYARKPVGEKRTKTVSTKLTDKEYNNFKAYIEERGLATSEAIRLLILEELGLGVGTKRSFVSETQIDQKRHEYTNVDLPSSKVSVTSSKTDEARQKSLFSRFTYKPWEVDGKLPCTICKNWYHSSTFSARHAKEHGFRNTKKYFVENIEMINQMYKEMTRSDPVYDSKMLR